MLKNFCARLGVVARYQQGPLAEHLDQLVLMMQQQGYARDTMRTSIRSAAKFSWWLEQRKYTANDVTDALVGQYLSGIQRCASGSRPKSVQGLAHMVRLLRQQGIPATTPNEHAPKNIELWSSRYANYLTDVAGLRESSRIVYLRHARYLLVALFPDDRVDWTIVGAESLSNFVRQQAEPRQGAGRSTPGVVVRSFIRFLGFLGELDPRCPGRFLRSAAQLTRHSRDV